MSTKKLAMIRDQIATLVDEREEIEFAPISRADAEARIAAVVNAPFSDTVIDPGGPNARVDLDPAPTGLLSGTFNAVELLQTLNRPSVLRAVFPEQITKYLLSIYDQEIGDRKPGLPAAERRKRLVAIDAQIYELERAEESLIEALEADGTDITRRADADPRAQLGLSEAA